MTKLRSAAALLALTTSTYAQGFGGNNGGHPYSNGDHGDGGSNGNGNNGFGGSGFGGFDFSRSSTHLIAHAVLGTLAFGFFFPVGGIMIRLASFRGLWLVHGLFQMFGYLLYIAAFGTGIWMVQQRNELLNNAHPRIGIALFVLIFFQPFLGLLHHFQFIKHNMRVFWSYAHIWLGRFVITLGIINGGLGLQLAKRFPLAPPSNGAIAGYAVAAGLIWLLYVISAVTGERRRSGARDAAPPAYKETYEGKPSRDQYA